MTGETVSPDIFDPQRWGLLDEAIASLATRLRDVWARFRPCFQTRTRDGSAHAWTYLRGLLSMDSQRNFATISRRVNRPEDDGQNLQPLMSDSPWSEQAVRQQVQQEIAATPALRTGGALTLDECKVL